MTFAGLTIRIALALTRKVVLFSIGKMTGFFQMSSNFQCFCAFIFSFEILVFLQKIVSLKILVQSVTCVPQVDLSSWFNSIKWAINLELRSSSLKIHL